MIPLLPLQLPLPAALIFAGIGLFLLAAGLREAVPFLVDDETMARRSVRAAAVSILLGGSCWQCWRTSG